MTGINSIRSFREPAGIAWGQLAPHAHLLQFYEDDAELLESLEAFVAEGVEAGDGVIAIATPEHLETLRDRLGRLGISLDAAIRHGRYLELDAHETLSRFMIDGSPDPLRFRKLMHRLIDCAGGSGRPIRVFGELVVTLWTHGNAAASVRLERLWTELCDEERLALLCAYPLSGLACGGRRAMHDIIAAHSKLIAA